jgi:hypothetical protein
MKRKALVIGINKYPAAPLRACVNDATAFATVIGTNGDGSPNFEVRLQTDVKTNNELMGLVRQLFSGDADMALFYFSGHGYDDEIGTYLVTPDAKENAVGVSMNDLLIIANNSAVRNKIIILDCCHAGGMGASKITGGSVSTLNKGITILAASKSDESALEIGGHGVFTNLLLAALQGGAADIRGIITPGSIYAYIDQALGTWDQRPVFKTNVTEFVPLRSISPLVPLEKIRRLPEYFPTAEQEYALDPSHEYTNSPDFQHQVLKPYAIVEHGAIFKDLQKFQSVGLVVPVDAPFMYFAAMEGKSCRLTALGYHYWRLASLGRI